MAYTIGVDLTWEQYSEILKIAAEKFLEVKTEIMYDNKWVTIENLPLGCGYGDVYIRVAKSHRRCHAMFNLGAEYMFPSKKYTALIYRIPNTEDMITKVKSLGATISRDYTPTVRIIIPVEESIKQVGKE